MAGLLSEQVVDRVVHFGKNWLAVAGEGAARYERGFGEELKRQNKSLGDLRALFPNRNVPLESWLKGKEAVPHHDQLVISAFLGKKVRDLFSDLPNDVSGETNQLSDKL